MVKLGATPKVKIRTDDLSVLPSNHFILHEELESYLIAYSRDINKDFYHACFVMLKNWGDKTTVEQIP